MCQNRDCQVIVGAPAGSGDPVGSWNRRASLAQPTRDQTLIKQAEITVSNLRDAEKYMVEAMAPDQKPDEDDQPPFTLYGEAADIIERLVAAPRSSAGRETALLATLVYEAMRFAIWAAGQGIMPDEGEPAQGPEDFLYEYSKAIDIDDWDGLAEVARDHIRAAPQGASNREAVARAIFNRMAGAEFWNDRLWLHRQDMAYLAADDVLALSRPQHSTGEA
jgi:hypothetical protein